MFARFGFVTIICSAPLCSSVLRADFHVVYKQSAKSTSAPVGKTEQFQDVRTNTVAVSGNRKVSFSEKSAEIIDLDKGTVTSIDFGKKTYCIGDLKVMKRWAELAAQLKAKLKSLTASVKETGQQKTVQGMNASEHRLELEMIGPEAPVGPLRIQYEQRGGQATLHTEGCDHTAPSFTVHVSADIWTVPDIPGYQEIRDFDRRLAEKVGQVVAGPSPIALCFAEEEKEISKLNGVPVIKVSRQVLAQLVGTETTTEMLSFSSAPVDPSKFEVPSGFTQVPFSVACAR